MHSQEIYTLGKDNNLKVWIFSQSKSRPLTNRVQVMQQKIELKM